MMYDLPPIVFLLIKIVIILVPVLICVAYYTLAERKVAAYIQGRIGANRVGFRGLLQPFADALKFLNKEYIYPAASNPILFTLAPILSVTTAMAAWAVIPVSPGMVVADICCYVTWGLWRDYRRLGLKFKICYLWCYALNGTSHFL